MLIQTALAISLVVSIVEASAAADAAYTEATIYTEPHNAASAAIGTANFIVGRMARECYAALGESESFVQSFTKSWQQRNEKYIRAATIYAANVLSYYERTKGSQAKEAALREYVSSVRGQGAATVEEWLAKGERADVCRRFRSHVEAGSLDMGPTHPLYKEATELVGIIEAFQGGK